MYSQFDLVEELTYLANSSDFVQTGPISTLKGHVVCISGTYFIHKAVSEAYCGDLLTGFSMREVKAQVATLKKQMDETGVKFKLVFNGTDIYADKSHFHNQAQTRKRFYYLLWRLEVMKCLSNYKEESTEGKIMLDTIDRVKTLVLQSSYYKAVLERELAEFLFDYLFELEIEFVIAPGKANNQLVWLYSYDYCEAVLGDLSLLPFSETVTQIITDLDFQAHTFSYVHIKDFAESLRLLRGKEKRQIELWSFTVPVETQSDSDINIIQVLEDRVSEMEAKAIRVAKERGDKVQSALEKIHTVLAQIDCNTPGNDKNFLEAFQQVTGNKYPKRESIILRLDSGQVINSSCEYALFPNKCTLSLSEQDKKKLKDTFAIDFTAYKRLYSFYSFDLANPYFLLLTIKASKFHIYFPPPCADSKEYRTLLDNYIRKDVEHAFANFVSVFGKLSQINEYAIETYSCKDTVLLNIKEHFHALESGDKVFFYFKEAAFKQYDKLLGSKGQGKMSFKNATSMVFQCVTAIPESSDLNLSILSLKKGGPEVNLARKELVGLVMVNLLDELDYFSVKHKKFMILGAGLMRRGSDIFEDKLILLFEMMRFDLMSGEFMNPPDIALLKKKKKEDQYLVASLRKTSEEIRNRERNPVYTKEEEIEVAGKRKESEFRLHFDEDFNREPTVYDYEKIINMVSLVINESKERYLKLARQSGNLHEDIEIFALGLQDKNIPKVIVVARVFCLIDAEIRLDRKGGEDYLQDFDTSQFLSVLSLVQKNLRFKVDGYFSVGVNWGAKSMLLKDIEEIKCTLPFRMSLNGHLSNMVKLILTRFLVLNQVSKARSEFAQKLEEEFTLSHFIASHPQYKNLKEDLTAGFHLFSNLMRILEHGHEKSIENGSSPVLQLWMEAKELLREAFKKLGLAE